MKLIIFGAAKLIYKSAKEAINSQTMKIVAFSDNDERKTGKHWGRGVNYEGIPIISPDRILDIEFDYILIGAWYSYSEIWNELIALGIPKYKIMPLYNKSHIYLLNDVIDDIDTAAICSIYTDGEEIIKQIWEVNEVNRLYEHLKPIKSELKTIDYEKYHLIAHACGGLLKGEKIEYTNSLEALMEALKNDFKMIECDVWGEQDGKLILGSRLKMAYPIYINYTVLTLDVLLRMIADDINKKVILDIKWNTLNDFCRLLTNIDCLVRQLEKEGFINIRRQIIIETFDEDSTKYAINHNWECILTDYRNKEGAWIKKTACICCKYNIKAVMLDAESAIRHKKYIKYLISKNIDIVSYTVDEIEDYVALKKAGVKSILSNYLKPFA